MQDLKLIPSLYVLYLHCYSISTRTLWPYMMRISAGLCVQLSTQAQHNQNEGGT